MLGLRPDDRVLEVGGGTGASARLVGDLLTTGHLVALDRSPTATRRIATSCEDLVQAGRLSVITGALADAELREQEFDVAFSVDVNVFWTSDAAPELAALRRTVRPGGRLAVCFGTNGPQASRLRARVLDPVAANLARSGFTAIEQHAETGGAGVLARTP